MDRLPTSEDLELVIGLERELQTPMCRADRERVTALLATDFVEIGASGRRWDLADTLAMLRDETADQHADEIEMTAVQARPLAAGVAQVLWDSRRGERRARRNSIWCLRNDRWQQVYHQGTLLP